MAKLKVLVAPDPRLKKKALPIKEVDDHIRRLMEDMLETMYAEEGIGLAATQVGENKRVLVIDIHETKETPRYFYKMANPEILWISEETFTDQEGCLSVLNYSCDITRPKKVKIRFLDENNVSHELEADEWLAKCIQHEIDHLNGKLFIDHLSPLKREMALKKSIKAKLQ